MSYNTSDSHRCYLQNLYNTFWGMTIFTKCFIINCRGIVVNDNHKVMSMVSPYKDKKLSILLYIVNIIFSLITLMLYIDH